MRMSEWISYVCSSDLLAHAACRSVPCEACKVCVRATAVGQGERCVLADTAFQHQPRSVAVGDDGGGDACIGHVDGLRQPIKRIVAAVDGDIIASRGCDRKSGG